MANYLRAPCEAVATKKPSTIVPAYCEKWILLATILGSSLAFIDGTIVNIALPAIQDAFNATINQLQWVVEAYALTLAALVLVGGSMGDIYGRRFIFLVGIFTLASVWCGFAMTIMQLILARSLQGIGAALLIPASLALISASFAEEKQGKAFGTWAAFTSIMTAAGPLMGGWLIQHLSWRWVFFLNAPIAIIAFIITLIYVKESKNEDQGEKLDLLGALLVTLGLGAITFGLIEWHNKSSIVITAEIIGICALAAFVWVEARTPFPMLPLKIFRSKNFSAANVITFFLYFALYGVLFFLPLDLIQVQGYTATQAGAAFLPLILLIFLLSRWAGGLLKVIGPRLPLMMGSLIAAIGFFLFAFANARHSYWTGFFPAAVVLGLGMAIVIAPLTTLVMTSVSEDYVGTASGINNAITRIAGLLAIAILGLVMTVIFNHQLEAKLNKSILSISVKQTIIQQENKLADIKTNDLITQQLIRESFITGYQSVLWIATILALISSITAGIFINKKNLSQERIIH
jgi:EmrB/QacA subfamily drug resistance transporter